MVKTGSLKKPVQVGGLKKPATNPKTNDNPVPGKKLAKGA
jgi:hypothetical protein